MSRVLCLFAFLPMLGGLLRADWKIVTKTGNTTVTEYFKGNLIRTDPAPAYTTVWDFGHRSQITWRSDLRQYTVADWPPEQRNDLPSGPVIVIERTTKDTGERKQFFGRTARRMVTHVTRSDGPETVIDGWYVEAAGLSTRTAGAAGAFAVLTAVDVGEKPAIPRIEVKQTGPAPDGLAVWEKMSFSMTLPDGSRQMNDSIREVVEFVEGSLPERLFQPPEGYRRVTTLPGVYRRDRWSTHTWTGLLQAHWQMIEDWLSGLFGTGTAR